MLPNHYLFILAERPPADMASLLAIFHPVPPVVRRRSKELLDAIRETVKQQLGGPSNTEAAAYAAVVACPDGGEPAKQVEAVLVTAGDVMHTDEDPFSATSTALWSHGENLPHTGLHPV